MFFRIVFFLASLTAIACTQASASAPEAPQARSQEYVEGYKKGHDEARAKLKAGKLALLGFGMPPDWIEEIYNREFGKYGIAYEPYGHANGEEFEGYVAGFNEPMAKAISEKHGVDTIASIQQRIANQLDAASALRASEMKCIGYASPGAGGTIKLALFADDPGQGGALISINKRHHLYGDVRKHVGKLKTGKQTCVKPWSPAAKAKLEAALIAPETPGN